MTPAIGKGLHLHFDPSSGVAGDMTVAALVDAGVPSRVVMDAVRAVGGKGLRVGFEKRKRGALVGQGFKVAWPGQHRDHGRAHGQVHGHDHGHDHAHGHDHDHGHGHGHEEEHLHGHDHRDHAEIRRLLRRSGLAVEARTLAEKIFARIATEEASLHGVSVDRVRFHEVGAWDSIADIVGAAAALAWLEPAAITSTPPVLGSGVIHTAHGLLPVPAPATAAILRGVPVLAEGEGELTTPTGAAILATVVDEFTGPPPMRIVAQGFGAGTRAHGDRPNVLRALLGETLGRRLPRAPAEVVLLETNLDDMNPQLAEPLMEALFAAGAVDVWFTPITMKKGRPAVQASALCAPQDIGAVEHAFFANSSTLGVRRRVLQRTVLERAMATVTTRYGEVRVKLASRDGELLGATPEFEDCRKLALRAGVPVRKVVAEAGAAAHALLASSRQRRT
jgi:uncharacterized protein (TIGR00299 family) protein